MSADLDLDFDAHEGSMAGDAIDAEPDTLRMLPAASPAAPVVQPAKVKIPKILHVIWVGPHDPPVELINSWEKKHVNGWFFCLYRDHTGWQNQAQIDKIAVREWNGVADLMRLEILAKHGGFCVDADSECLRALDEGPEDFVNNSTAILFNENESARPGIIGCGIMGAPKGSPFFAECVRRAATKDMSKPAWTTVGPLLVTEVARDMPSEVRVYPSKWAHPVHYSGTVAPGAKRLSDGRALVTAADGSEVEPYAVQKWGGTRGYNALRKWACSCQVCRYSALRPPWG